MESTMICQSRPFTWSVLPSSFNFQLADSKYRLVASSQPVPRVRRFSPSWRKNRLVIEEGENVFLVV